MCGIFGMLSQNNEFKNKIGQLNSLLRHRGPDDEGYAAIDTYSGNFVEYSGDDTIPEAKVRFPHIKKANLSSFDLLLCHRRLSIIDLSANGHEPMCDDSGQIWLTYNGEIYNYIELREELKAAGHIFKTETDTEVIIAAYKQWGTSCLNKFNGMWAFALWDGFKSRLFLARDRFGVKPLYYSHNEDYFAFSSEIKVLISLNPREFKVNMKRIPFFILYGNRLNQNDTFVNDIYCLKASHYLIFEKNNISVKKYYDIQLKPRQDKKSEKNLSDELISLLTDSIKLRLRSDVPVGTCLSGGFDSSSIVLFSSKLKGRGLNTFSAVWQDIQCDESKYIDVVNAEYRCAANKIEPKPEEFEKIFNELSYYQEIPTEGPGLYPQWYVMKKAKEKVKVLLNGQGGDEVFGGYYMLGTYLRSILKDKNYKNLFTDFLLFFNFLHKNGIHGFSSWLFPKPYNKVVRGFLSPKKNILNKDLMSKSNKNELYFDAEPLKIFNNYVNNLSYHLITSLTIPQLLHYEDRASMAHSIENRVPYLDYRLVEFGVNLPKKYLSNKDTSRPLFRTVLSEFLPKEIVNRKDKLGYPAPFAKWSRGILKRYITDVLSSSQSGLYDYIDKNYLNIVLNKHFNGNKDYSWEIWRILSLERFLGLNKILK